MNSDYYSILGVPRDASFDDIKKAYKKMALELHPDRNKNADATDRFKKATEAYKILSDVQKKRAYDSIRGNPVYNRQNFNPFRGSDMFSDALDDLMSNLRRDKENFHFDDIQEVNGKDIELKLEISLKEAVFGCQKVIESVPDSRAVCETCHGNRCASHNTRKIICAKCSGNGKIINESRKGPRIIRCTNCKGFGDKPIVPCPTCRGTGEGFQKKNITVKIPAGVDKGTKLRLSGMGIPGVNRPPGDLYVEITVQQDLKFERDGLNLITKHYVPLLKAIKGGVEQITLLDGSIQTLIIPQSMESGKILIIKGAGVRIKNVAGDLNILVNIKLPKTMSARALKLIEELEFEIKN